MKKILKYIIPILIFFAVTLSANAEWWAKNATQSLVTNDGSGFANADIHVRNCYLGVGTGSPCGSAGSGSVTSVGLALPSIFTVSGSPVTTTGTLTGTFTTQTANKVFAGPVSGGAATPTFRSLVAADIPAGILTAAGANTNIQFNDSGVFGGDANLIWDKVAENFIITNSTYPSSWLNVLGNGEIDIGDINGDVGSTYIQLDDNTQRIVLGANESQIFNPNLTVGADVVNDMYYRSSSGILARIPIGSTGNVLGYNGSTPTWGTPTVRLDQITAAIGSNTSSTNGDAQIVFNWGSLTSFTGFSFTGNGTTATGNSQTVFAVASSGANTNNTQTTFAQKISNTHTGTASSNVALQLTASGGTNNYGLIIPSGRAGVGTSTPSSLLDVTTNALGVTQATTSGLALVNTTAAAVGAQQISPAIRWSGSGWKTTATAAAQAVDFQAYVLPVQGTGNPTGTWKLQSSINAGSYTDRLTVDSAGTTTAQQFTAPFVTVSNGGALALVGGNSPITLSTNAGTTGQLLTSAGAGATPTWTTPSSITLPYWKLTGTSTLTGTTHIATDTNDLAIDDGNTGLHIDNAGNWTIGDFGGDNFSSITGNGGNETMTINVGSGDNGLMINSTAGFTINGPMNSTAPQTIVSASSSGNVTYSEPFQGSSYKKVVIYLNAALGTASYTFDTAFSHTPGIISTSAVAAGVVTSLSTTAVTVTGATTTGFIILEGF